MFRKTMLAFTTATVLFSGAVLSGEIYKWTDQNGDVHYEDRPDGADAERLEVVSRSTDNAAVQASIDARRDRESARAERRSKREDEVKAAADKQAEADQRIAKCQESRARMESYLTARRLYNQDDAGERSYLDEEQIMAARAKAQEQIQKYCD